MSKPPKSLVAQLSEAHAEIAEWKQAAGVEANLRREFQKEAAFYKDVFEKVDPLLKRITEILGVWRRGCTMTFGGHPGACDECTSSAVHYIRKAMEEIGHKKATNDS